MHTGVDVGFGMIHSLEVTSANVHDLNASHALLHGEETHVYANGVNRTKDKQIGREFIAETRLSPDRNQELALKPGYSEVP